MFGVLKKRDMRNDTQPLTKAMVDPSTLMANVTTTTVAPHPSLEGLVDYYWVVRWSRSAPYTSQIIPQPRIHLAEEHGQLNAYGINTRHFTRTVLGDGHVIGTAFRPAAFSAFTDLPLHRIRNMERPANDVLRVPCAWSPTPGAWSDDQLAARMNEVLLAQSPRLHPTARLCMEVIDDAQADRSLIRAESMADRAGRTLRSLERAFATYVGATPKWVIARSRVLDAMEMCHETRDVDWGRVALELGFADQAHFIRAFKSVVGDTPARYHDNVQRSSAANT